jgi:hypothetical protein
MFPLNTALIYANEMIFQFMGIAQFSYFVRDEPLARKWCDKRSLAGEGPAQEFGMLSLILPPGRP